MKEGEEVGDGRAEGVSAVDGGQAAISFMPDIDCKSFASLLDSIYAPFWKTIQ